MLWSTSYIPIESLAVETYQPPLNLRRTEVGLRYLFKKQANSSNQWDTVEEQDDDERMRNRNGNIPCEVKYKELAREICKDDTETKNTDIRRSEAVL